MKKHSPLAEVQLLSDNNLVIVTLSRASCVVPSFTSTTVLIVTYPTRLRTHVFYIRVSVYTGALQSSSRLHLRRVP